MSLSDITNKIREQHNKKLVLAECRRSGLPDADFREAVARREENSHKFKKTALAVGENAGAWYPMCFWCGAIAAAAGVLMYAHLPVVATTLIASAGGAFWFMCNTDTNLMGVLKEYGAFALLSTAIALPASLAGPVGPIVAGCATFGVGLVGKFIDYMTNDR